jgi:hypothetical protein
MPSARPSTRRSAERLAFTPHRAECMCAAPTSRSALPSAIPFALVRFYKPPSQEWGASYLAWSVEACPDSRGLRLSCSDMLQLLQDKQADISAAHSHPYKESAR